MADGEIADRESPSGESAACHFELHAFPHPYFCGF